MFQQLCDTIDGFTEVTGRAIAWLMLAMMGLMFLVVVLRYLFSTGSIALQESVMYLHATLFMAASAFTLKHDGHVRVDIFYRALSPRGQAAVNLFGTLFLLLPVCLFTGWFCFGYVAKSWALMESSPESGGLPLVYLLKSLMLVLVVTMILQGIAELIRNALILVDRRSVPVAKEGASLG